MFTLKSYQDQVYNIGSPSPNPSILPLQDLPKATENEFTFPPVKNKNNSDKSKIPKATPVRNRKRKLDSVEEESPLKKAKMISKEELDKALAKERVENKNNIDKVLAQLSSVTASLGALSSQLSTFTDEFKTTNSEVKEEISSVKDQMKGLQSSVDDTRVKFESKFVELEGTVNDLQKTVTENNALTTDNIKEAVLPVLEDNIIPKVKADLKKEILGPVETAWNAIKAQEVQEHEHNLIVFNYNNTEHNMIKAAGDFLKNVMKIPEDELLKISIKQAYKLGKGKQGGQPPMIVKFGHPSDRNHVLTFSKNISDKKISVEKDIPKSYQNQYKVFKEIAFKLRNMPDMNFQTQIIFDGPFMRLRYKKKDSGGERFHYVIHSSWKPPLDSSPSEPSTLRTPVGTKATPAPDASVLEKANSSIFMTLKGMTNQHTCDTYKNNLKEYLKVEHKDQLIEVRTTKRPDLIVLYCVNWEAANTIANTYKEKFMDCEVSFSAFTKSNPASML